MAVKDKFSHTIENSKATSHLGEEDVLSEQGIKNHLGECRDKFNIKVYNTISSTNTVLKEMAAEGASEWTVLVAGEQTAGRGRMNRSFFSPANTGLYISILLRPRMNTEESLFLTTAAAVAVSRAIEDISGKNAGIKWVNDVFIDDKKVCGILTEASLDMESRGVAYAISGIGVNVYSPQNGFPDEISDIAGAVFDNISTLGDVRNRMAAKIIEYFAEYYETLSQRTFFEEYVRRSIILGKEINVIGREKTQRAKALEIDRNCNLRVRYEDGSDGILSSGEVSIRQL